LARVVLVVIVGGRGQAARRALAFGPSRAVTRAVSACSAWCRAERTPGRTAARPSRSRCCC